MKTEYSHKIPPRSKSGVRSLSTALKTLAILDRLASLPRGARLSEVAELLGVSRPTAYQRLFTLVDAGWVEQDEVGRYRLSLHSCRISAAALEQASLGERLVPALEKLVSEVSETASLAVLDHGTPCIVQRVESVGVLRAELKIGAALSLSESASGRVLAAFADEGTLFRLKRGNAPLPDDSLLKKVRSDGYAVSSGRVIPDVCAIAAPVFDYSGKCVAAISLVGPSARFDVDAVREPLLSAAKAVTNIIKGAEA